MDFGANKTLFDKLKNIDQNNYDVSVNKFRNIIRILRK